MKFSKAVIRESKNIDMCIDYNHFDIVPSSSYSCLMPYMAITVAQIVQSALKKTPSTFIDATANIGCDALNFCNYFNASCIAIESDEKTYLCLSDNICRFNKLKRNNHAVHGNCIDFIDGFKPKMDFVYFDPPWGGPKYWKEKKLMLYLMHGGKKKPIYDVILFTFAQKFTDIVILKTPSNFDHVLFSKKMPLNTIWSYPVFKKRKDIKALAFRIVVIHASH
jgi:16S rRNA G966 N2-methylase RsmD